MGEVKELSCENEGHILQKDNYMYGCRGCMHYCRHQLALHREWKEKIMYCTKCGHMRFFEWDVKFK